MKALAEKLPGSNYAICFFNHSGISLPRIVKCGTGLAFV